MNLQPIFWLSFIEVDQCIHWTRRQPILSAEEARRRQRRRKRSSYEVRARSFAKLEAADA